MDEQIAVIKKDIVALCEGADFLECENRDQYALLIRQEDSAVAMKKQVEEYFNPDIKKAHELHKSLTAKRKAMLDPIESFIGAVKRVTGGYLAKEQEKAKEQAVALEKQAAEMGIDTSLIPQNTQIEAGEGRAVVQTWCFEVSDESLIPRQYMTPNLPAIKAVVTALKDKSNIPGIKVRMETSVRRTGKWPTP